MTYTTLPDAMASTYSTADLIFIGAGLVAAIVVPTALWIRDALRRKRAKAENESWGEE